MFLEKWPPAREWALGAVRRHHLCPCVYRPQRGGTAIKLPLDLSPGLNGEAAAIGKQAVPQCPCCCAREFTHVPGEVGLIVVADHHRQISEIRRLTGADGPDDASESQHAGKAHAADTAVEPVASLAAELNPRSPAATAGARPNISWCRSNAGVHKVTSAGRVSCTS